jgi:hypothetical protein
LQNLHKNTDLKVNYIEVCLCTALWHQRFKCKEWFLTCLSAVSARYIWCPHKILKEIKILILLIS